MRFIAFVRGSYFHLSKMNQSLKGQKTKGWEPLFKMTVSIHDSGTVTIKPSAFSWVYTVQAKRQFSTEEWSLQHSSVFLGLSVCESWYFRSQHGSTRGVRLTTVIVLCWSRLPQPWDWTMKYSKMPGLREGGLWQCNVKCETIEHL